jgi:hypothetical protein
MAAARFSSAAISAKIQKYHQNKVFSKGGYLYGLQQKTKNLLMRQFKDFAFVVL